MTVPTEHLEEEYPRWGLARFTAEIKNLQFFTPMVRGPSSWRVKIDGEDLVGFFGEFTQVIFENCSRTPSGTNIVGWKTHSLRIRDFQPAMFTEHWNPELT